MLYSSHLSGIEPKSETAFTLLAAFGFLSLYFGIYTGYAITTFAELKASFARTSALLSLPEKTKKPGNLASSSPIDITLSFSSPKSIEPCSIASTPRRDSMSLLNSYSAR